MKNWTPLLVLWLALASNSAGIGFRPEPLAEGEDLSLEVLTISVASSKVAPLIATFDGSHRAADACYVELLELAEKGEGEIEQVYRKASAAGTHQFESKFEQAKPDAARLLRMRFVFRRSTGDGSVQGHGFVNPSYLGDAGGDEKTYASELSMFASTFEPGKVKLLSVLPDAPSGAAIADTRLRVAFCKLRASEKAIAAFPPGEDNSVSIGIVATEVSLPLSEWEGVDGLGLSDESIMATAIEQRGARAIAIYAGETSHLGRVRQRVAWHEDAPLEPNDRQGCFVDCDPEAVTLISDENPPEGAGGVLIDFFAWQRLLPKPMAVETTMFRWNESWDTPGINTSKSSGRMIDASTSLGLWLPDTEPRLAAIAVLGDKGTRDRRAILLFVRSYLQGI